jgi:hypothetical protein
MPRGRILLIILAFISMAFLLFGCSNPDDEIESTDLSELTVNGMKLGDNISAHDLSKFKISDTYGLPKDAEYKFEYSIIGVDKNERID